MVLSIVYLTIGQTLANCSTGRIAPQTHGWTSCSSIRVCSWRQTGPTYITFAEAAGRNCNEPPLNPALCNIGANNVVDSKCIGGSNGGICDARGCSDGFVTTCECQ